MEREVFDLDVLYVGAGPASLSSALHLHSKLKAEGKEISIGIIEKAQEIGAHSLSGAVLDPKSIKELIPDFLEKGCPIESEVLDEKMYYMTESNKIAFPYIPKQMSHHGCYIVSIGKLTRWLGKLCEDAGIDIFAGFPGSELLYDEDRVIGVRTGDRGIDKSGNQKPNYEPGVDIHAKTVVLGEGTRGSLTKQLIEKYDLMKGKNPQVWAIGVKELWKMPEGIVKEGFVGHTMGFPLGHKIFGGGFLYGMKDNLWDLGIVVGLDYADPTIDPHHELQLLKTHPWIKSILKDGEMVAYGAKTLPEGGWYSIPKLNVPGALLIGDSAGFLNGQRLKGIHLAIKSGMVAADTIYKGIIEDNIDKHLNNYETNIKNSWIYDELYGARNFHQAFDKGLIPGLMNAGAGLVTGGKGWGFKNKLNSISGHKHLKKSSKIKNSKYDKLNFDGKYLFDKVTNVYHSSTSHNEDQVPHLHVKDTNICIDKCTEEYGNPCEKFCPADVYNIEKDDNSKKLQINFSNCVHCKTCDIMDPYQIIDWVTPEGGDGPGWLNL
jgi:electron-transferring-flavoprotein dehydrogenase